MLKVQLIVHCRLGRHLPGGIVNDAQVRVDAVVGEGREGEDVTAEEGGGADKEKEEEEDELVSSCDNI